MSGLVVDAVMSIFSDIYSYIPLCTVTVRLIVLCWWFHRDVSLAQPGGGSGGMYPHFLKNGSHNLSKFAQKWSGGGEELRT